MEVYDEVLADSLENDDQIIWKGDYVMVESVLDDTDKMVVKGYSLNSGETVTYNIPPHSVIQLWSA